MQSDIRVWFVCGCGPALWVESDEPPICLAHQERRIRRVDAPHPTFTIKESAA